VRGPSAVRFACAAVSALFVPTACGAGRTPLDDGAIPDAIGASDLAKEARAPDARDAYQDLPPPSQSALAIAAEWYHTCAVTADHHLLCWGFLREAHPSGFPQTSPIPIEIDSNVRATSVSVGFSNTCVIEAPSGLLSCWGDFDAAVVSPLPGQTSGRFAITDLDEPVLAAGHGDYLSCALTTSGRVLCWEPNFKSPDGMGDPQQSYGRARQVMGLSPDIVALAVGGYHACALSWAGEVRCWGSNEDGQLGGLPEGGFLLAPPVPIPPAIAISAGYDHSCALTAGGAVKCWGYNRFGQLGNHSVKRSASPVDVPGLGSDVVKLFGGSTSHTTCVVTAAGLVKCWGSGSEYLAFPSVTQDGPVEIPGLDTPIDTVAVGMHDICAASRAGRLQCWGRNDDGQLGNGTYNNSQRPELVVGF
jgi:alpha-tubulin suppressor-like RCC1 family protein